MLRKFLSSALALTIAAGAYAQLPPDAVMLDKVKIPEKQKSQDLDPVTLEAADPALGTFEHEGVVYGMSAAASKEEFLKDPAKYAAQADAKRWENNFVQAMSIIWCPVTDEISPGGNTIWKQLDLTWESCCQFCNDTVTDADFPPALERLKKRAAKGYELLGKSHYTEGASSPVEGAINLGGPMAAATETATPVAGGEVDAAPAWLKGTELQPTWAGGVGLIFENRCMECHRNGGAAPMPFLNLGQVRKWTAKMKDVLQQGTMPPWPASPNHSYANSKRLTPKELETLIAWIDAGFAPGEGEYTPARNWDSAWMIGEPDHVFDLDDFTIPEDSAEMVREFDLATGFDTDKFIIATEVRPTDTYLVLEITAGPLGAYHVGNNVTVLPEGHAFLLKKGESVKVRVHYTKEAGWEEFDTESQIAVKFATDPGAIKHAWLSDRMANDDFTIPAGKDSQDVTSEFTFEADGAITALNPVMRLRGKKVAVTATMPDGSTNELLNIPYWDPAWNFTYILPAPLDVPKGTKVTMTANFDNSDMNAKNPDAAAEVKAGANGELAEGWLSYTLN